MMKIAIEVLENRHAASLSNNLEVLELSLTLSMSRRENDNKRIYFIFCPLAEIYPKKIQVLIVWQRKFLCCPSFWFLILPFSYQCLADKVNWVLRVVNEFEDGFVGQ